VQDGSVLLTSITGWSKTVRHCQIIKNRIKACKLDLVVKVKYPIKHYKIIRWY